MNNRPKPTDSEKDILEMQNRFLAEKSKNINFQPAAQAVNVKKKKVSVFAKSRAINTEQQSTSSEIPLTNIVLGKIIEKPSVEPASTRTDKLNSSDNSVIGFPKPERISLRKNTDGKSLFALSLERKRHQETQNLHSQPHSKNLKDNYGNTSTIVEDSETANSIHEENLQLLGRLTKEDILAERETLLQSMDPNVIKFLQTKRKTKIKDKVNTLQEDGHMHDENMMQDIPEDHPATGILQTSETEHWVNFDIIEKEKLEWMKDIPMKIAKLKPGEAFEARFDWKGVLLPYSEDDNNEDNRELYLHGDEPHRPGYTLQELFRLCRSNVIQQRVTAFSSIAGILNIYNQGFYDQVLDLPISKIFFLLRFGLDENIPPILEVVSKGLSTLFYNDTDEIVLDVIYETSEGYLQPILEVDDFTIPTENDSEQNITQSLANMKLTSSPFRATVEEDEDENKTSMNDFQLAETDLVECFLRTNIIQRISYILGTIKPDNSTVHSCLKILIRIARSNKNASHKIAQNTELLQTLFKYFLPALEQIGTKTENNFYDFPQYLVLKLFRVLISQHISFYLKLSSMNLIDHLKRYLFSREDIKAKLIKVQIESLRNFRAIMLLTSDKNLYKEILPAFKYMLEWHYQHIEYTEGGPFLLRQHASSLIAAICTGPGNDVVPFIGNLLVMCSCKWFNEATRHGIKEFSQSTLLSSCLHFVSQFINFNRKMFMEFIEKYLRKFLNSESFLEFNKNLSDLSILLNNLDDRHDIHKSLPNLGSILNNKGSPQLIISQTYPIYLLKTLLKVFEQLYLQNDKELINLLLQTNLTISIIEYLKKLSNSINRKMATNFLVKNEINFIFKLICFDGINSLLETNQILQITFNLLCCMSPECITEIEILFTTIIFTRKTLNLNANTLSQWKEIYLETFVYPHRIVISPTDISLAIPFPQYPILPFDWPYTLLKSILNRYLRQMSKNQLQDPSELPEREVIRITLTFTELLERNGLEITSPTEKLMYLMIAFMGSDSEFLEPDMKLLLKQHLSTFYNRYRNIKFNFNATFEGKSKFENLYVLFLDHFQGASYGDDLFSSLVLVPLAQKYDTKWRKMVWSEHASVLRFLNCNENQLLGSMEDYLHPIEEDISLIKCYARALNSNLLRVNTIPYKIASHHVNNHKLSKT